MSRPTISDVAVLAGVSRTTVSRYLNSPESVSRSKADLVKRAMDRLNYRPNSLARTLRTKRSKTLGLIVPDITAPFFAELAAVVQETASEYGYTVFLCSTNEDTEREARFARTLIDHNVDGVIYIATGRCGRHLDLESMRVPVVALDRLIFGDSVTSVVSDNAAGGTLVADHLIQLGHTKALLVMGPTTLPTYAERLRGFLLRWTASEDETHRTFSYIECDVSTQGARKMVLKHIDECGVDFTCVFAGTDFMAAGVLMALSERGVEVPGRVSVVGYDNSSIASITSPPLTTVDQPKDAMARLGVEQLISMIESGNESNPNDGSDTDQVSAVRLLTPTLVVGCSTSRAYGAVEE